jgi:hypothetical protein
LLGHIRRPTGAALNDYKRQNFEKGELDVEKLYLQHCKNTRHERDHAHKRGQRYREKSHNCNDFLACIKGWHFPEDLDKVVKHCIVVLHFPSILPASDIGRHVNT